MELKISGADRLILREVAKKQIEFASQDRNATLKEQWYRHNALQGEKPMVVLESGTFGGEVVTPRLRCTDAYARSVEASIYHNFVNQELFEDDKVTPDYYGVNYDTSFKMFDLDEHIEYASEKEKASNSGVGIRFVPVIGDLEEDMDKIKPSSFSVDIAGTKKKFDLLTETFGDILPVRMKMNALYSVPTQKIVHLMDMENMMVNMVSYPELFKKIMDQIADDTLAYFDLLEQMKVILPTTGCEGVAQGTFAFNRELPDTQTVEGRSLTTKDVWGYMDSQETVSISPHMFEELVFPCYERIASRFGLLSYGCCEPVHPIWDSCISKLKNLRKVSISAWCDEEFMGERLRGSRVIYHRKPRATFLGYGDVLDEEAFRAHIDKSLAAARGCKMEITQRDVYTIHHDIPKAHRYVEIIREEIEDHWK